MLGALFVLAGFVLIVFAMPLWLATRHGRHVVGPVVEAVNYDQPYPGLGMFATRKGLGDFSSNTRQKW
jgi:hypothetical protein